MVQMQENTMVLLILYNSTEMGVLDIRIHTEWTLKASTVDGVCCFDRSHVQ